MKMKLYLRGLGIGLIIGALALMLFGGSSDSQNSGNESVPDTQQDSSSEGTTVDKPDATKYATAVPLNATMIAGTSGVSDDAGSVSVSGTDDEPSVLGGRKELPEMEDGSVEKSSLAPELASSGNGTDSDELSQIIVSHDSGDSKTAIDSTKTIEGDTKTEAKESETASRETPSDAPSAEENPVPSAPVDTSAQNNSETAENPQPQQELPAEPASSPAQPQPESPTPSEPVFSTSQSYNITIPSGSGSTQICNSLAQIGVIDNAAAFDRYLCSRGLDRKIRSGSYRIPEGSGYAEIAALIAR